MTLSKISVISVGIWVYMTIGINLSLNNFSLIPSALWVKDFCLNNILKYKFVNCLLQVIPKHGKYYLEFTWVKYLIYPALLSSPSQACARAASDDKATQTVSQDVTWSRTSKIVTLKIILSRRNKNLNPTKCILGEATANIFCST